MAKGTLLSMSSLNGSLGGLTFRNSEGGNIMYGKSRHAIINSPKVSIRRMLTTYFAQAWRSISADARRSWVNGTYAGMSGYKLFLKCHLTRSAVDLIPVISFSVVPSIPDLAFVSVIYIHNGNKTVFIAMLPATNTAWSIEVQSTPPMSVGIGRVKESLFRTVLVLTNANSATTQFTTGYNAAFGSGIGATGSKAFTRVRLVHKATGAWGPWVYTSAVFS